MKKVYVFFCLLVGTGLFTNSNAQIAAWDLFGAPGSPATFAATTFNANLVTAAGASNITRGAGAAASAGANSFRTTGFQNDGISTANTDYFQITLTANTGFILSLSTIDARFNGTATYAASPGVSNQFAYSLDGTTFTLIGTPTITVGQPVTMTQINVSGIAALQNVPAGTTVTLRYYASGQTNTGGWGFYSAAAGTNGLAIGGNIAAAGPTAAINVTPSALTGFSSLSGVPTAEQTYSVDGSSLTNDITITPPVGFQIATVTGGPYTTNPASITLTQTGGVVNPTTIYVRMNSATLGVNTGNITHTSAGANNPNVSLTGNVLAAEPTVQSTITFGAITNSTIQVNFAGGNGARRILLAKALTAVDSDPVDGTTYTANAAFGAGTQLGVGNYAVYDGTLNTVLVTGLTAGTMYHFAVYEYNDGGVAGAENYLVPGGAGNTATIDVPVIYTWTGGSSTWTTPGNWAPVRTFPATNDILLFLDGTTETVTAVPNETIGQLHVTLGTNVTLQAAVNTTALTITGSIALADLTVDATSTLHIDGANGYSINLTTGTTGTIDGAMTFTGGAHRLTAVDASAITFSNGAVFTAGTGFTGNSFGTTNLLSVIFASGSRYDQVIGSNPFGAGQPLSVVVFQAGSLYRNLGNNFTPSFSGRTYANVEFAGTGTSTMTGGSSVIMDNLTITSGTVNINMTGNPAPGHSIRGNISVAGGAVLNFAPAASGTMNLNGTAAQSISNLGTLTFNANQTININNSSTGITLNTPITLPGTLTFTNGVLTTTSVNLLTMAAGSTVTGASNASFVNGPVSKIGNSAFTFPVGKLNCGPSGTVQGYAALNITNFVGGAPTDRFTAEYLRGNARAMGPVSAVGLHHVSACDYWTFTRDAGASTVDISLSWDDAINNCTTAAPYVNFLPSLTVAHFDGANWDAIGVAGVTSGTTAAGTVTWGIPQSTTFGIFTIGSVDFNNPLPVTLNFFNGYKQNNNHLLNWRVTCYNMPSVTMELERSSNGTNYNSIYSINATALQCQQPFSYTDASPVAGINYYRLKMTDANGKVSYSSIVPLINGAKGIEILNIAPNPITGGKFNLRVSAAQNTTMEIMITDMQGRMLQKQKVSMIAGYNSIPVNVANLAAGTYQVYGNTEEGRSKILRFVVQ